MISFQNVADNSFPSLARRSLGVRLGRLVWRHAAAVEDPADGSRPLYPKSNQPFRLLIYKTEACWPTQGTVSTTRLLSNVLALAGYPAAPNVVLKDH